MKTTLAGYNSQYYPTDTGDNCPLNISCAGYTYGNPNFHIEITSTDAVSLAYYQLEYVTEGKGYIGIDGKTFTVEAGDFFVIKKSKFRSMRSDKKEPLKKYFVSIKGSLADGLISGYNITESLTVVKTDVCSHFKAIMQLLGEAESYTSDVSDNISVEIMRILQKAYSCIHEQGIVHVQECSAENIMAYIDMNIERKFTIEEMCKDFFVGKTKLWRIFKQKYGISPIEYAQTKRIERAKYYLLNTDTPISIIHESIGMCDAKYFSKCFKSHTGMTPNQFKKAYYGLKNISSKVIRNWDIATGHPEYSSNSRASDVPTHPGETLGEEIDKREKNQKAVN